MEPFLPLATGLVGTVLGAAIAWFAGRRTDRLKTAFDMHREFHSLEMTRSRNRAGATVRRYPSYDFDDLRRRLDPDDAQHVWNVLYFYQRLSLAVRYRNVHARYIGDMFGENFVWWYLKSYRQQLVTLDWQATRDVQWLTDWLVKHAQHERHQDWVRRAEAMEDPITGP
jgi:hypothetical protein